MPQLESAERVDRALALLRDYHAAQRRVLAAQNVASEVLGQIKTMTGITANDAARIEEEILLMVGRAHVAGVMER